MNGLPVLFVWTSLHMIWPPVLLCDSNFIVSFYISFFIFLSSLHISSSICLSSLYIIFCFIIYIFLFLLFSFIFHLCYFNHLFLSSLFICNDSKRLALLLPLSTFLGYKIKLQSNFYSFYYENVQEKFLGYPFSNF